MKFTLILTSLTLIITHTLAQTVYIHGDIHTDPHYQKQKEKMINLAYQGRILLGREGVFFNIPNQYPNTNIIPLESFDAYFLSYFAQHTWILYQHLVKKYYYEELLKENKSSNKPILHALEESYPKLGDRELAEYIKKLTHDINTYTKHRPSLLSLLPSSLKNNPSDSFQEGSLNSTFYQTYLQLTDSQCVDLLTALSAHALEQTNLVSSNEWITNSNPLSEIKSSLDQLIINKVSSWEEYEKQITLFQEHYKNLLEAFTYEAREIAMTESILKTLHQRKQNTPPFHIIVGQNHVDRLHKKLLVHNIDVVVVP